MCQYRTLYHNDAVGYAIHCTNCNTIQFAFGNVLITFMQHDFTIFHEWIGGICAEEAGNEHDCRKSITVPMPCDGLKLLLSKAELYELNSMLDTAETELRSQELLSLFK
jgi:hypothetical protein